MSTFKEAQKKFGQTGEGLAPTYKDAKSKYYGDIYQKYGVTEPEPAPVETPGLQPAPVQTGVVAFPDPVPAPAASTDTSGVTYQPAPEETPVEDVVNVSRSFVDNIAEAWSRGLRGVELDALMYEASLGLQDYKQVAKMRETFEKKMQSDPVKGTNWLSDNLYKVVQMAGPMLKGYTEGGALGATYAAGALAAGQMGPQAIAPEEVITMPAAFAAGMMTGSGFYWYRQGAGQMYGEMRKLGIDDKIAKPLSHAAGVPYAAIEFSQVSKIIPGMKRLALDTIRGTAAQIIKKLVTKYGQNWATEVSEEVLQDILMFSTKEFSKALSNEIDNTAIGQSAPGEWLKSIWNTTSEVAIPMAFLLAPGAAVTGVTAERIKPGEEVTEEAPKEFRKLEGTRDAVRFALSEDVTSDEIKAEIERLKQSEKLEDKQQIPLLTEALSVKDDTYYVIEEGEFVEVDRPKIIDEVVQEESENLRVESDVQELKTSVEDAGQVLTPDQEKRLADILREPLPEEKLPTVEEKITAMEEKAEKVAEEEKGAKVKFMITNDDKKRLGDLGYSAADIKKMKPDDAQTIINQQTPAGNKPITDRQTFRDEMKTNFNLDDMQADAVADIADARAETWAKQTGNKKEDWYKRRIAGIRRGQAPETEEKLFQKRTPEEIEQNLKNWFRKSKVTDEKGKPKVVYSGHYNVLGYGEKYKPYASESGGFYATESPEVASNYATGKYERKGFTEGEQYKFKKGKGLKYSGRLWNQEMTPKQHKIIEQMKNEKDENGEAVHALAWMDQWIEDNAQYDKEAYRMKLRGGSKDLWSIYKFYEWMGENIVYADMEDKTPTYLREDLYTAFEEILNRIGADWQSTDRSQPGVFPLYLSIQNPIVIQDKFPDDVLAALKQKAKYEREKEDWRESLKMFVESIEQDEKNKAENPNYNPTWSTQIPKKAVKIFKEHGYDGIQDRGNKMGGGPDHNVWIAFDPNQIKSATGNIGTYDPAKENILYQEQQPAPTFYSKLENLINEKMPNKANSDQVRNMIKKGGIKEEELQYSGIADLLNEKESVTKQEVLDRFYENQIEFTEVIYDDSGGQLYYTLDEGFTYEHTQVTPEFRQLLIDYVKQSDAYIDNLQTDPTGDFLDERTELDALAKQLQDRGVQVRYNVDGYVDELFRGGPMRGTRYEEYTLPGGEKYREMMLTLPTVRSKDQEKWLEELTKVEQQIRDKVEADVRSKEINDKLDQINRFIVGTWQWAWEQTLPELQEEITNELEAEKQFRIRMFKRRGDTPYSAEKRVESEWSGMRNKVVVDLKQLYQDKLHSRHSKIVGDLQNRAEILRSHIAKVESDKTNVFTEGHFEEPNVLAHVRFKERMDKDGKKILFIEEIQSDWHQEGRKRGYRDEKRLEQITKILGDLDQQRLDWIDKIEKEEGVSIFIAQTADGGWGYSDMLEQKDGDYKKLAYITPEGNLTLLIPESTKAAKYFQEIADIKKQVFKLDQEGVNLRIGLPDAPFKKTWHELTFKRMVRWAAERGFDSVGWTTGKQQIDRYESAIRKNIDEIEVIGVLGMPNARLLRFSKNNKQVVSMNIDTETGKVTDASSESYRLKGAPLENVVGREIANKILSSKGDITIAGDDLSIGGQGMKGFYDDMLVRYANKFGKRYGAKTQKDEIVVGKSPVNIAQDVDYVVEEPGFMNEVTDIHKLPITDDMRFAVINEGMPLFQEYKGATQFLDDGRAIIHAFENADVSTAIHELAHIFRRDLNIEDDITVLKWTGQKTWNRKAEEKFARGFENYLRTGTAPNERLIEIFESFKEWLKEIYGRIKGTAIDVDLSPEVKDVFDRMLGVDVKKAKPVKQPEGILTVRQWVKSKGKIIREHLAEHGIAYKEDRGLWNMTAAKPGEGTGLDDLAATAIEEGVISQPPSNYNPTDWFIEKLRDNAPLHVESMDLGISEEQIELMRQQEVADGAIPADWETDTYKKYLRHNILFQEGEFKGESMFEDPMIQVHLSKLIKDKIKHISQGVRKGKQLERKRLEDVKMLIQKYARKYLPPEAISRGQVGPLLTQVAKAKNLKDVDKAYKKIDAIAENVQKRTGLERIKNLMVRYEPKVKNMVPRGTTLTPEVYKVLRDLRDVMGMSEEGVREKQEQILERINLEGREPTTEEEEILYLYGVFGDMAGKDAAGVAQAIRELNTLIEKGQTEHRIQENIRLQDMARIRNRVVHMVTGGKGVLSQEEMRAEGRDKIDNIFKSFDNMQQSFEWLMDKLSRYHKKSKPLRGFLNTEFGRDVRYARNAENQGIRELMQLINDKMEEIYKVKGRKLSRKLRKNNERQKTGAFITKMGEDGKEKQIELEMSQNEAYKKWLEYLDPKLQPTFEMMGWTDETFKAVEKFLLPEVKEWALWQINEFYPDYYETINKTFRERFFVDLPFNEFYTPISRDKKGETDDDPYLKDRTQYGTTLNSSLRSRVDNTHGLRYVDGDQVLMQHILQMEHFKNWTHTVRKLRSIFNSDEVSKAIKQYHGQNMLQVLNKMIDDLARGGVDRMLVTNALDKIRANFTRAVLGINPTVFLKQLTSFPAYASDIPVKDFIAGVVDFNKHPIKSTKTLMSSEMMKARYSVGFERDIMLAMKQSIPKKMSGVNDLSNALMLFTKLGDRAAILYGGWSVYKYHYDQQIEEGAGPETAHKNALNEFESSTKRMQQAGDVEDLGEIQRMGSWAKLFTMFMTSPNQYYRAEVGAIRNLIAGRGSKTENVKRFVVAHFVLPMMFQFAASGFRWEDEKQLRAALLGSFNGLLILGDFLEGLFDALFAGSLSNVDFLTHERPLERFQRVAKEIGKIVRGNEIDLETFLNITNELASATSKFVGVPFDPVKRITTGIYEAATGGDIRRALGYSEFALKKTLLDQAQDMIDRDQVPRKEAKEMIRKIRVQLTKAKKEKDTEKIEKLQSLITQIRAKHGL